MSNVICGAKHEHPKTLRVLNFLSNLKSEAQFILAFDCLLMNVNVVEARRNLEDEFGYSYNKSWKTMQAVFKKACTLGFELRDFVLEDHEVDFFNLCNSYQADSYKIANSEFEKSLMQEDLRIKVAA